MKKLLVLLSLCVSTWVQAQDFNQYFENKTLRLDYVFGGNNDRQFILLDELVSLPTWGTGVRITLGRMP